MLVYFKSTATMNERGTVLRMTKEGIEEVKAEFERLRKLYDDDWGKVNEGLKLLYSSWDKDDPRKSLARFTRVDEKGPYRDDGNISWPGGGGPRYDVMHPVTHKPCKVPSRGWIYPNPQRMKEEIDRGRVVFGQDETTTPRIRTNLFEADKEVMRSVHFSYAQTASQTFNAIFDNRRVFENPKSIDDIKKLVEYVTVKDDCDIILDFFSGSATTAHAVMQLNAEDGGHRRYIMVQLPEVCDEKSEAFKAGYKNICEIGKERIRRAGAKILEEAKQANSQLKLGEEPKPLPDVGFKVFKLDSSNLKIWDDSLIDNEDIATLFDRIDGHLDGLKPDRSNDELVFEILLKMGYPLTSDLSAFDLNGLTVYTVENNEMLICLQPGVTAEHVEQMAAYQPKKIVLASHSLADSSAKANAYYLLENQNIELKTI